MPSFDIVSEVDAVELKNAVENTRREMDTRFDFRGVEYSVDFKDFVVTLRAETDFQCGQMVDILRGQLAKRNVDAKAMELDPKVVHTGKTFAQTVKFKQGIEQDVAKKLVKLIKDSKVKVQAQIQGDSVRVTGKKRDDLQAIMQLARTSELGQPFQFNNFRD
ncbi:YajQ family cyclic di-GMP-binding protein [Shewanella sp. JM162201]|uniref:Nucleotide-binding protein KJI95_09040 n=1 Tax=Shewanella jiangmenensis TaxID=2837387 RepID=A0ABS5V2J0_9GAMM|nr:YajQ family cyclic di-GMP-binding protein [Shewanella jiangmenensis]MBT1444663.1 YajQ family cyclic di-GMP-binding protein [Shewanella jiangmenensis]